MKDAFELYLEKAIKCINEGELEEAEELVKKAIVIKPEAAQPHNLFGILAEYRGDRAIACKHYRAAWALDETYTPGYNNLERITGIYDSKTWHRFDFGIKNNGELEDSDYYIEYEASKVGHIKRKFKL